MLDALVAELAGISELMDAQEKAGVHKEEVLQCLCRSWTARLTHQPMKLTMSERQQLTAAITACPWGAEQCKSLAEIVLTSGSKKQQPAAALSRFRSATTRKISSQQTLC